jgi:RimJ/RimL family protein N-acetyltransferase
VDTAAADGAIRRPPETMTSADLVLTRLVAGDIPALVVAVNESLGHLRPWMAWAAEPATTGTMGAFVDDAEEGWRIGSGYHYAVRRPGTPDLVAGCGLHVRPDRGVVEIGYWVHVAHVRRGIATALAAGLTGAALELPTVDRVEIRCDITNVPSAGVPEKLGFTFEGVEQVAPDHAGQVHTHMIWGLSRGQALAI